MAQTNNKPAEASQPTKSNNRVLFWILGGCFGFALLVMLAMVALGWWGARKVKNEINKYAPEIEQMKENADKWNEEAEEWQKKSAEYRESLPSPEELEQQIPVDPYSSPIK